MLSVTGMTTSVVIVVRLESVLGDIYTLYRHTGRSSTSNAHQPTITCLRRLFSLSLLSSLPDLFLSICFPVFFPFSHHPTQTHTIASLLTNRAGL